VFLPDFDLFNLVTYCHSGVESLTELEAVLHVLSTTGVEVVGLCCIIMHYPNKTKKKISIMIIRLCLINNNKFTSMIT
jgi:hypothetical protein